MAASVQENFKTFENVDYNKSEISTFSMSMPSAEKVTKVALTVISSIATAAAYLYVSSYVGIASGVVSLLLNLYAWRNKSGEQPVEQDKPSANYTDSETAAILNAGSAYADSESGPQKVKAKDLLSPQWGSTFHININKRKELAREADDNNKEKEAAKSISEIMNAGAAYLDSQDEQTKVVQHQNEQDARREFAELYGM